MNNPDPLSQTPVSPALAKLEIHLGAMREPLQDQLQGLLPEKELLMFEQHANAITRLKVHALLNTPEARKLQGRLISQITERIKVIKTAKDSKTARSDN